MTEDIKEQAQQYSFSTGDEFTEDLEEDKESRIQSALQSEEKLAKNIRKGFYMIYNPEEPSYRGIGYLYTTAHHVLTGVINDLRAEGEEELAEKMEEEMGKMREKIHPNTVERELDRSERLNHPSHRMKAIIEDHSMQMRSFASWAFAGTSVTTERAGTSSPGM